MFKYINIFLIPLFIYCEQFSINSDGVNRNFNAYFPMDTSNQTPMIILMHGLGGNAFSMESLNDYFLDKSMVTLFPQAYYYENLPIFGVEDNYFLSFKDRPGLMTKKEVRMIILGELGLKSQQIIWDIGAGTGSVSIEIARLCPNSQIYAIEKTAMGINLINKNSPNRIFLGGSGGNLIDILDICQDKLAKNGIIIIALATIENLGISLNWIKKNSWNYQLLNINISGSLSVGNLTRLAPLNPIFLVKIFKKNKKIPRT